jgi:hypothetical protein
LEFSELEKLTELEFPDTGNVRHVSGIPKWRITSFHVMYDASCQHKYEWVLDKVDFNLTFWADKYVYVITDTDRMMTYGQEIALQVS